jgi:ferritin-like metal-binding protein YciE
MTLWFSLPTIGSRMSASSRASASQQKVAQYLGEAHTNELALVRVLQSQIAMTPNGAYRSALDNHLEETRGHAGRIAERLRKLDDGSHPLTAVIGFWEGVVGQAVALSKTPFDLMRGSGGEEKVLKNAKDACAAEALEIATYTAIERLARTVGDEETATLAASIRADEERMLERVLRAIPKLAEAVVGADVKGEPSYDVATTGAAEAVQDAGAAAQRAADKATGAAKGAARQARRVPGVAQAEGQVKGAGATEQDLAIAHYDQLTAEEIIDKLRGLSQIELAKTDAYERRHDDRSTVLSRISSLRGDEPWPGYDELTVSEVHAALSEADEQRLHQVRSYERAHKNRAGVLNAVNGEPAKQH